MTFLDLAANLLAQGIALRAERRKIAWRGPAGAMTDELKAAISEHREQLLSCLTFRADWPPSTRILVYSKVLEEEIIWHSDDLVPTIAGCVGYSETEVRLLIAARPDKAMLQSIHGAKAVFSRSRISEVVHRGDAWEGGHE